MKDWEKKKLSVTMEDLISGMAPNPVYDDEFYQQLFQNEKYLQVLNKEIYRISVDNLAQLCSVVPLEMTEKDVSRLDFEVGTKINFVGPFIGTLCLLLYGKLAEDILINMLGETENHSDILKQDAVGEIANIICGNILPSIATAKNILKMTPPSKLTFLEFDSIQKRLCIAKIPICLEKGKIEIYIFVKNILFG